MNLRHIEGAREALNHYYRALETVKGTVSFVHVNKA
jgi:hypothetical protein